MRRAPRGTKLSCIAWPQEAAIRMLQNNLDPDVAERPGELIVYGGTGRAARSGQAFDRILETLRRLKDDETLLVQSGKPVGLFRTQRVGALCPHLERDDRAEAGDVGRVSARSRHSRR